MTKTHNETPQAGQQLSLSDLREHAIIRLNKTTIKYVYRDADGWYVWMTKGKRHFKTDADLAGVTRP